MVIEKKTKYGCTQIWLIRHRMIAVHLTIYSHKLIVISTRLLNEEKVVSLVSKTKTKSSENGVVIGANQFYPVGSQ